MAEWTGGQMDGQHHANILPSFQNGHMNNKVAIIRTTFPLLQVNEHIFQHSRARNSNVNYPIWPTIKLSPEFIPSLATCEFEALLKKILKPLSWGQHFPYLKTMGKVFDAQRHVTPLSKIRFGPQSNLT